MAVQSSLLGPLDIANVEDFIKNQENRPRVIKCSSHELWTREFLWFNRETFYIVKTAIDTDIQFRQLIKKNPTKLSNELRQQLNLACDKCQEIAKILYNPDQIKQIDMMSDPKYFYNLNVIHQIVMYKSIVDLRHRIDEKQLNLHGYKMLFGIGKSNHMSIEYLVAQTETNQSENIAIILQNFQAFFQYFQEVWPVAEVLKKTQTILKLHFRNIHPLSTPPKAETITNPSDKCSEFNKMTPKQFGLSGKTFSDNIKQTFYSVWMNNNKLTTEIWTNNVVLQRAYSDLMHKYIRMFLHKNYAFINFSLHVVQFMLEQLFAIVDMLNEKIYANILKAMSNIKEKSPPNTVNAIKSFHFSGLYTEGSKDCVQIIKDVNILINNMYVTMVDVMEGDNEMEIHSKMSDFETNLMSVIEKLSIISGIVVKVSQSKMASK